MKTITKTKSPTRSLLRWLVCALVLLGFSATNTNAQNISTYTFAQNGGNYVPLGAAPTSVPGFIASGCNDDQNYATLTLPFSFTYHGTAFTTIGVSDNGYAKLGGASSTYYSSVLGSQANTFAVFARDLYGCTVNGAALNYTTLGTTPNRVFIVEWNKYGYYSGGLAEQSFQLQLLETSNTVRFVYGKHTGTTANTMNVGLNGATVGDIQARTTTTDWTATTAGTSASTCTVSSTIGPPMGLTYQWTSAATVAGMTFSSSVGGYVSIIGATITMPGFVASGCNDDQNYATLTLPFTFTYHGTPFTTIGVSDNGYAHLGGTCATYYSSVLASQTNTIAAFARDLYGCTANGAILTYKVSGVSPNRTYVIEWSKYGYYSSGGLNEQSFQIQLQETTNEVLIVYGPHPGATSNTMNVGLNGATVGDIQARTTTTNWLATTAGTSASTMTVSSTIFPANGTTYSWTPPTSTPCSGTPAPGATVTSGANPICSGTSFTLSTANAFTGISGLTFQWQTSPNNVTWTNQVTTATYTVASQTTATYYRCIVTCTASGLSGTSTALQVTQNGPTSCYCIPPQSSSYLCCSMYMSNVTTTFGATNFNNSSVEGTASYQNYSATKIASQLQNQNVTVAVTTNGYGMYIKAWIDFNDNGTFDVSEQVLGNGSTPGTFGNTSPGTVTQTFTVPVAAPAGTHRMRVRAEYYGNGTGTPADPCGQLVYGETEDYGFTVIVPPPCAGTPAPGNTLSTASPVCSGVNFTLSMQNASTLGTGSSYQWQSSPTGTTYTNIAGATSLTYTGSQTTATYYQCFVTCANGGASAASTPINLTMNPFLNCYCTPTYVNGTSGSFYGVIHNVSLNTMNANPAALNAQPYYLLNTPSGANTTTLVPGQTYTLSVNSGVYNGIGVWIDFNQSGTYDASEFFNISGNNNSTGSAWTGTATVTVPLTAVAGLTGMRVSSAYYCCYPSPVVAANGCGNAWTYGETEDYQITTAALPATPATPVEVGTPTCSTGGTVHSTGSAPSGVTWYWQTTATGTSLTQPVSSDLTILANGTYYVRAYDNTYLIWSTSSSSVTVSDFPAGPAAPTITVSGSNPACGAVTLVSSVAASGATNYWQGTNATGTSTASLADNGTVNNTYAASSNTTFYLGAQDNTTGCWSSLGSQAVTIYALPTAPVLSATPTTICPGSSTTLNATAPSAPPTGYTASSITYGPTASGSGTVTYCNAGTATTALTVGTLDDGVWSGVALPFSFNFYGTSYSTISIYTNGYIAMGTTTANYTTYGTTLPSAAAVNTISGDFNDLYLFGSSNVTSYVSGTTPNRIFVVSFLNTEFYSGTGNCTFTIELHETTNVIEVHLGSATTNGSDALVAALGVENAAGTLYTAPSGRNGSLWTISSPEAWRFSPTQAMGFLWTPNGVANGIAVGNEVLATTAANPGATTVYTMTLTDPAHGCTNSGTVTVNVSAVPPAPTGTGASTGCGAGTVTLTATGTGGSLSWYRVATGGTVLATGGSYTTPTINADSTYYVAESNGTCFGPRAAVVAHYTAAPSMTVTSDVSSVCSGGTNSGVGGANNNTANLSANTTYAFTSYTWSPAAGLNTTSGATVVATPSANTTYTCTATDGTCTSVQSVAITVGTVPTLTSVTASPATVCQGGTSQLAANVPGLIGGAYVVSSIGFQTLAPSGSTTAGPVGDDVTATAPIGFSFNFYGTAYTNCVISTNGFISMTGASGAGCCSGLVMPSTGYSGGIIALDWMDLNTNSGGNIDYFNLTSPNRFVVRFNNVATFSAGGTVTGEIVLYQTGEIEIYSGSITTLGTAQTQGIQNIGGTVASPITGRNGSAWNATNSAYRIAIPPPVSLTFAWTPNNGSLSSTAIYDPVATLAASSQVYNVTVTDVSGCYASGSVTLSEPSSNPGNTISSSNPACASSAITLSVQNPGSGANYQWQTSADGITWVNASGTSTNATYVTTQSTATYYRCGVGCASGSTFSNALQVTQNPFYNCYCIPTNSVYNCTYDWIGNVTVGNINNTTSTCTSPYLQVAPSPTTTTTFLPGSTYTISLSDIGYSGAFDVFIDFNHDGAFSTSERVLSDFIVGPSMSSSGSYTGTTTITIPSTGVTPGATGMRVRYDYYYYAYPSTVTGSNTGAESSCGQLYEGGTQDYTVTIGLPTASSNGTICEGGTVNLTATPNLADSYAWTGPNGFASALQNPSITNATAAASGIYTCVITIGGTPYSDTALVTVNPAPVATATGNTPICTGSTTAITLGSSISSSTFAYTASVISGAASGFSGGSGASIAQTLTNASTTTAGVVEYVVTTTVTATGCVSTTPTNVDVTVNGNPSGSASNTSICSGTATNIALSSSQSGSTFTWTGAQQSGATVTGGGSGSGSAIQQTLTNGGNSVSGVYRYTVTPTSSNGCVGATFITDATVKPTPVASSSVYPGEFLCGDGSSSTNIDLNSSTGASTYTWTSTATSGVTGNSSCSTGCANPIADVLSNSASTDGTATYSIIPTSSGGCVGGAYTIVENIGAIPVASTTGSTTTCSGSALNLALNSTVAGTTYTWFSYAVSGTVTGSVDCGGGCASSITDVLVNNGTSDAVWEYDISSVSATGCPGVDILVDITVHPGMTVTVPTDITQSNDAGLCSAVVTYTTSAVGNPTPAITYSFTGATTASGSGDGSGSAFNGGVTNITVTATSSCGTASNSFNVIINDTEAPVIVTQAQDMTVETDGAGNTTQLNDWLVTNWGNADATDNCSDSTWLNAYWNNTYSGTMTPGCGTTGTTGLVGFYTYDQSFNVSPYTYATFTIVDLVPPVINVPAATTIAADAGVCTFTGSIGTATATDDGGSVTITSNAPAVFPLGLTPVTWTATDACGNNTSGLQNVTVIDTQNPTIATNSNITQTSDAGVCTAVVTFASPSAADNCSISSVVCTPASGSTFPSGTSTVTCVATDGSGNTATSTFTVTITDNQFPTITAPAAVSATTNTACTATGVNLGTPTTADNCTVASVTNNAPTAFPLGLTVVTWTVTDAAGNATTATQNVTVTDNVNPTITAPAAVSATTNTACTATGVSLGTPTTADNCSIANVANNAPSAFPLGLTVVTWTVTDGSGNTATATQNVTVTDNVNPTITAPAAVTVCNGAAINLGTPTTADNCSVASVTNNHPSNTYPVGTTVVTWTVTDGSGNQATATQNVVVNPLPVGSGTSIVICNGDPVNVPLTSTIANSTFTWTQQVTTGAVIGSNDCASGCGTNISDILTNLGNVHGVVQYTVTPTSPLGCVGAPFIVNVTVGAAPAAPVITGPSVVCQINTTVYTCAAVPEATNYTWTVPTGVTGMTITSGQGTTALHVTISAGTVTGNVTCTASNNCGNSTTTSMAVTKKPAAPPVITGPTSVCGQTTATYSVAPVFGATSYSWTLPTGMTIASGAGTTQITVTIATTFVSGNVVAAAVNACGNIPGTALNVTGNVPIAPATITGPTYVCGVTSATYTTSTSAGATGYQWTVTGTGMSISGPSTGTSVTVLFDGTHGGTVSVKATNVCGQGPARTLTANVTAVEPGVITGPTNVCGMTTATYSVASVGSGYTYNWITPNATITIASGQGTNTINVTIPAQTGTTTTSGILKVTSSNTCASTSAIRSESVTRCLDPIGMNTNTYSNIYPNPTTSEFTIDVTTDVDKDVIVEVYDVLGNLLMQQKHQTVVGVNTMKTNIEEYKDGMYFVRLLDTDSNVLYTQRVIKQ